MRFNNFNLLLLFLMGFDLWGPILFDRNVNFEVIVNLKGTATVRKYSEVKIVTLKIRIIILCNYDFLALRAPLIIFIVRGFVDFRVISYQMLGFNLLPNVNKERSLSLVSINIAVHATMRFQCKTIVLLQV